MTRTLRARLDRLETTDEPAGVIRICRGTPEEHPTFTPVLASCATCSNTATLYVPGRAICLRCKRSMEPSAEGPEHYPQRPHGPLNSSDEARRNHAP